MNEKYDDYLGGEVNNENFKTLPIEEIDNLFKQSRDCYIRMRMGEFIYVEPRREHVWINTSSREIMTQAEKEALEARLGSNMNKNYEAIKKYLEEIDDRIFKKEKDGGNLDRLKNYINTYLNLKFKTNGFLQLMSGSQNFDFIFGSFKGDLEGKWDKYIKNKKSKINEILDINETRNKELKEERERSLFYKRSRNALYRHAYLIFYNTIRVISNVKIEYDFWRSDTGKHIWGVNSSANIYYKYHSSWSCSVFNFNFFYIEFSFGLFHLLLRPLKRISRLGSYFSPLMLISGVNGLEASEETPFWEMINISLVQISIGPVKINGLGFSFFDPIFFIISLCFMTYLGLDKVAHINMHLAFCYLVTCDWGQNKNGSQSTQKKGWVWENLFTEDKHLAVLEEMKLKLYKIKQILGKINLVKPGYSRLIHSFASYFMKNILYNTLAVKFKYHHYLGFSIKSIFLVFRECLTSAPQCLKYMFSPPFSLYDNIYTTHTRNILRDYYSDDGCSMYPVWAKTTPFQFCDMFFLCLSLLLFSMIDSVSIDLRWFIDNETVVRKYCTKIKRKVCRFFEK